jgi:hypothetical protein
MTCQDRVVSEINPFYNKLRKTKQILSELRKGNIITKVIVNEMEFVFIRMYKTF